MDSDNAQGTGMEMGIELGYYRAWKEIDKKRSFVLEHRSTFFNPGSVLEGLNMAAGVIEEMLLKNSCYEEGRT